MSNIRRVLSRSKLMATLFTLEGNAKTCILLQPLWALPVNLYIPLAAKYMEALGLSAAQIGMVATTFLVSQMFFSLFSGVVTDKLGRRLVATLFDFIAWAIPFLLWMNARGFAWFMAAAAINGVMRLTDNAWSLLMVEDTPPHLLVPVYSLSTIAGLLSAFAAPLSSLFVSEDSLVPVMRWLYFFAFVCIVLKSILMYRGTKETGMGEKRKAELQGKSLFASMRGSALVTRRMFSNRALMLVLCILSCVMVIRSSTQNFWPLMVTSRLGVKEQALPLLSALKSLVQLFCFFVVAPKLNPRYFFKPMRFALLVMLGLHLLWYSIPQNAAFLIYPGVFLEALEMSILIPLFSSLQMLLLDKAERSKMFGLSMALCLLLTAPFGTINGYLYQLDPASPMLLSALLAGLALVLAALLKQTIDLKGLLPFVQEEPA